MSSTHSQPGSWGLTCAAIALLAVVPSAAAQTYEVNIHPTLNDLAVKIEPVPSDSILVIKLTNNASQRIRCDLRYDAAPQPRYRTTTFVEAGKTEQSVFRAKRKWFSVDVDVTCTSATKGS